MAGYGNRRRGGGGGEATVANLFTEGQTRKGIQFSLGEGDVGWGLTVDYREGAAIGAELDTEAKTAHVLYDTDDTAQEIVDAVDRVSGISAKLIRGTDADAVMEPHFVNARPFIAGEPYGQYTEVYVPAQALFEHPIPATALFEAVDGGAAGLTVTLGEPLEYGLDVNDWGITGHQRYQGTPDTPEDHSTLVEEDQPTRNGNRDFLGEFANRAAYVTAAMAHDEPDSIGYLRDENDFVFSQTTGTNVLDNPSMAAIERMLGARALILPYPGSVENVDLDNRAHFANVDAAAEYISENFDDFDLDEEWLYIDESRNGGEVRLITSVTPITAGSSATLDLATSATGGVRVTYDEVGDDGNDYSHQVAFGAARETVLAGTEFTSRIPFQGDTTAAQVLATLNAHSRLTAVYYGTEDGSTVITGQGGAGIIYDNWWVRRNFSGGSDNVWYQEAVDGEPADPIHAAINRDDENIEVYYNIAAGGRLTGPDELGDIRDYLNTHFEGLEAAFTGGADANTQVTRPFANRSQFAGGSLRGLRVLIDRPLAIGAEGNHWTLKARARYPGGGLQNETQAAVDIYTAVTRSQGVRITLEADIQGVGAGGEAVDVSSGALGNEWNFVAVAGTAETSDTVTVSAVNRQITYHSPAGGLDDATSGRILAACNAAGTGCSAAYFGNQLSGAHVFVGSLANVNRTPRRFSGGLDYHAATTLSDPIAVLVGPQNASVRVHTGIDGGFMVELLNPEGDPGNGWRFEVTQVVNPEDAYMWVRDDDQRVIRFQNDDQNPANTQEALARLDADAIGIRVTYYGSASGEENLPDSLEAEFLGGLDELEIEIQYAPRATGNIADADTMGEVKAVFDAVDGLSSFYYGGAVAATTANRATPWEHDFEDGQTEEFDLQAFALGPEQNTFVGADRAAAEAARDAYAAANPAWVVSYRGNPEIWISLRWGNAGGQIGQVLRDNAPNPPAAGDWVDQALALKGEKGERGPVGAARSDADINALIDARLQTQVKAYARTGGPLVMPSDAATTFMLDAEFTGPAILSAIGLTQAQLDDLLVGATLTGRVFNFPQADGSSIPITLPDDMDTQDGVVTAGSAFSADGMTLTLQLTQGGPVNIPVPALLRGAGTSEARVNELIEAGVKVFARAGQRGVRVGDIDSEDSADNQVMTSDGASGAAWEDQQGAPTPTPTHSSFIGLSEDASFSEAEALAGATFTGNFGAIPAIQHGQQRYVGFYLPASALGAGETVTAVYRYAAGNRNTLNVINGYTVESAQVDVSGDPHVIIRTNGPQNEFASGLILEVAIGPSS